MRKTLFSIGTAACLFALLAMSAVAADKQKKKKKPDLPKDFVLIDDFQDNDLLPLGQGQWFPIDDKREGGSTTVKIGIKPRNLDTDENKALHTAYLLGKKYKKPSGEEKGPQAFVGLSLGPALLKGWQDLSSYTAVSFDFQGEGNFLVILYTFADKTPRIHFHSFVGQKKWERVTFLFEDFVPLQTLFKNDVDPREHAMVLPVSYFIAVGPELGGTPATAGRFAIDDFGYIKRSAKELRKELLDTEKIIFGNLTFQKPKKHWTWKDGELKNKARTASVYFIAFPMHNDWRIPFPGGQFADPANVKQVERCTVGELKRRGLRDIRRTMARKITVGQFKSHRFVFSAKASDALLVEMKKLGISKPDLYVQVDLIKYRSVMYEIITFLYADAVKDQLPIVTRILKSLRKWKKN